MQLPEELSFIEEIIKPASMKYNVADWLLSEFDSNVWKYSFAFKSPKIIDWNVPLDDKILLTDDCNSELLKGLKYWLIASTQADAGSGSKSITLTGKYNYFTRTIHIIDYLLLRSDQYELVKYGLEGLTCDDLKSMLDNFVSMPDSAESVYGWSERISQFLIEGVDSTPIHNLNEVLEMNPYLSDLSTIDMDEYNLYFPIEFIPKAKAYLYLNGYYINNKRCGRAPNTISLSKIIYARTLKGKDFDKPTIQALSYKLSNSDYMRELTPVPVTTAVREYMGEGTFKLYRKCLYAVGVLHEIKIPAPPVEDLKELYLYKAQFSSFGRFRTLPTSVVFSSVKNALEFHLKYGKELVNSFGKICVQCCRYGMDSISLSIGEIKHIVSNIDLLKDLKTLSITTKVSSDTYDNKSRKGKGSASKYYSAFRGNQGYLEILGVYYGCVQIVVGALMARRVGELIDLNASNCLDVSETYLCFKNSKSTYGVMGLKNIEARAIEPIAVDMIKSLRRLQRWMIRTGYLNEYTNLFSFPSLKGTLKFNSTTKHSYNRNIDFFCDYFETEKDSNGCRYYIRQHQLRRFFALLFFYSNSFGGVETLQWMLGHTDPKHVWNYITETVEGTVLRGAKAQFVVENISHYGAGQFPELSDLLKARFDTDDFTLVDSEELQAYLEDLLDDHSMTIEPEFFEYSGEEKMRVIVKITETSDV